MKTLHVHAALSFKNFCNKSSNLKSQILENAISALTKKKTTELRVILIRRYHIQWYFTNILFPLMVAKKELKHYKNANTEFCFFIAEFRSNATSLSFNPIILKSSSEKATSHSSQHKYARYTRTDLSGSLSSLLSEITLATKIISQRSRRSKLFLPISGTRSHQGHKLPLVIALKKRPHRTSNSSANCPNFSHMSFDQRNQWMIGTKSKPCPHVCFSTIQKDNTLQWTACSQVGHLRKKTSTVEIQLTTLTSIRSLNCLPTILNCLQKMQSSTNWHQTQNGFRKIILCWS